MAIDKAIDSAVLDSNLTAVANAIRAKGGTSAALSFPGGFVSAIDAIRTGGGGGSAPSASPKDVNFRDYDGTLLYSYTLAEAQALTELPAGAEHDGLVFQGWNWSLENVKALTKPMDIGAMYTTDDGKTRLHIRLEEGRTSPMLGVCPNGTVDVDWGDGTAHDTLTGTSTSTVKWTPTHEYAAPGDYVITLTVDGEMGFSGSSSSNQYAYILRYASGADTRNRVYQNALRCLNIGDSVTRIGGSAFNYCYSLASISIPDSVTRIGSYAFSSCYSLASISIPGGVTSIGNNVFTSCYGLASISIPGGVTSIGGGAFNYCYGLASISIPDGVTSIGSNAFSSCYDLASISIPGSVTSIGGSAFNYCYSLASISIPDSVTSIGNSTFTNCHSLASISIPGGVTSIGGGAFYYCCGLASISIPDGVTSIESDAFSSCYGVRFFDFSRHTAVPTLSNTSAFSNIPADCEIRVPAALYDEWVVATNWSTYASKIVAV